MKAWRFFVFIGACLLLADISTVLALTESVVKQGASTKDLHSNSTDEPKREKKYRNALYERGNSELFMEGMPFGKYAIHCLKERPTDCPGGSACSEKLCWCEINSSLRAKSDGQKHRNCIDLEFPCKNEEHSPCHRNASCEYFDNRTFYCECNKGLLGDGQTCEKKPEPTTMASTGTPTKQTNNSTTTTKPKKQYELFLKKTFSIYHIIVGHVKKHSGLVIFGALCLGVMVLTITICLCRRRIRRKREKKLLEYMEDESHEGFEQQQFSSYPIYDEPDQHLYENIGTMDQVLGPLPSTPAPPPLASSMQPPPPPPPMPSKKAPVAKTESQSSFFSDEEFKGY